MQPRLTATAQLKILDEVDLGMSDQGISFAAAAKIVKERRAAANNVIASHTPDLLTVRTVKSLPRTHISCSECVWASNIATLVTLLTPGALWTWKVGQGQ